MAEQMNGLVVQWPILNFSEEIRTGLWDCIESKGIPRGHFVRHLGEETNLVLLRAYGSKQAMSAAGVEFTPENIDYLAADLEEELAEVLPANLKVPTYPVIESSPKKNRRLFSAACNPEVAEQRQKVIDAVNCIYDLNPAEGEEWHDTQYKGRIDIVSMSVHVPARLLIVRALLDEAATALPLVTKANELLFEPEYA